MKKACVVCAVVAVSTVFPQSTDSARIRRFETQLEDLRRVLYIPGMSAAIVKDRSLLWAKGFGAADPDRAVAAAADTNYRIASLTKTFASVLLMQLVEQGKLNLDDKMATYSPRFKERFGEAASVRHVFSHTSQDPPGHQYRYDGNRFSYLSDVIEKASGRTFREQLVRNILDPLGMSASVPGQDVLDDPARWSAFLDSAHVNRYKAGLTKLSTPHRLYGTSVVRTIYPPTGISASAGLVSNVLDLAKFDIAVDSYSMVKAASQAHAWKAAVSANGEALPYGLGWFSTSASGIPLIWHYGYWPDSFSSLYLKVPRSNVSLILLANSDALSAPFRLGNGEVMQSPFANMFLRVFALEEIQGRSRADLEEAERRSQRLLTDWLAERRATKAK
jgi:CubicO group peptidase (beta-lactamase class C family)